MMNFVDLELFAMSKERKNFGNASKFSICFDKQVYLPMKWNLMNIDLSHIKIMHPNSNDVKSKLLKMLSNILVP